MTGREVNRKYGWALSIMSGCFGIFPKGFQYFWLRAFRNCNGILGLALRFALVKNLSRKCGTNVAIHSGVYLLNLGNIEFGNNISIHPMCYLDGSGGLTIGNDVSIAHASSILTTNHAWDDSSRPIKYNEVTTHAVIIEDDVWVGCGCRILAGVKLGSRSVIAAGAVVNKDVESFTVVGGIPAKIVKRIEVTSRSV